MARTIEEFLLSDHNYLHAFSILQDHFGQTYKLITAQMQPSLNIPNPTNTLNSLRTFHDIIESHSHGLSSLKINDLLVPIILSKLPKDIKQNLARDSTTPEWTFPQLKSALLKEIHILETGCDDLCKSRSHTTAAFLVNSKLQNNKSKLLPLCVFVRDLIQPISVLV